MSAKDKIQEHIRDDLVPKTRDFINNASALLDAQVKLADVFVEWNRPDLASQLKAEIEETLHLRRNLHLHLQAMETVGEGYLYDPSTTTDFEQKISERVSQLQSRRFDYQEADEYQTYQQCISRHAAQETDAGPSERHEDDDEVQLAQEGDTGAPNTKCPVCGKLVCHISNRFPKNMDSIHKYIADFWADRNPEFMELELGTVKCPVAGTNHIVKVDELTPCFGVVRNLKRKRRQAGPVTREDVIG